MNSHITSLPKRRNLHSAFIMYKNMYANCSQLDACTVVALLKACADQRDVEKGFQIHTHISEKGLSQGHLLIGNALINMYSKCGLFEKAHEVFNELPVRDVVSWNTLLAGCVRHSHGENALEYLEYMQLEGVSPDAVTFVCGLKACGSIGAVNKGRRLHAEIATNGLLKENLILGNALMDMYGKCCLPSIAQEVFDNLEVRDVISWNTLMTGYLKEEQGEKALNCYEEMQRDGVLPNAVTSVCGLKACGLVKDTQKGLKIHEEISKIGLLEKNCVVGAALIDMYAKWGWLAKAREVLDNITTQDVNLWNALISGYSQHECSEEALNCLEEMQCQGVVPDAITFVCSLKACGALRSAIKGRHIHFEIERKGLSEKNMVVASALVDMYAKCGWLTIAQELFDGLSIRDLISWNVLIAGYVDHDCGKEALSCFERMQLAMVPPNAVTYACSLKACGILGLAEKGCDMYAEMSRKGLSDCAILVGNALVDMYAKCGLMAMARGVFDKLSVRDEVSWTALITGYNDIECGEEALKCVEQMQCEGVFPDGITLACSLKSCGSMVMLHRGKSLHAKFANNGLVERDLVVGSALVDMYAKCGLLGEALKVFHSLPFRDQVSWNALIGGYAKYELSVEASKCIQQMGVEGILPDVITLLRNLRSSNDSQTLDKVRQSLDLHAGSGSLEGDLLVGNTLVGMYAKFGCLSKAHELFDKLPDRNIISWNSLMTGYTKNESSEDALVCLKQMQKEGVVPDDVTFICSLKACGGTGATEKGIEIHAEIARRGLLDTHMVVSNALADMYAKCGCLAKAQEVFENVTFRDVISWNVLISGYAQVGDSAKAFDMFGRMTRDGNKPDSATFVSVLHACSQAVLVERGLVYFEMMSKDYGIVPNIQHHTCTIDIFARAGILDEVISKIKNLSLRPDSALWLTVLEACRKWGDIELGKGAYKYAMHPNCINLTALCHT